MNSSQIQSLRQRMGEAASLPHDDPQREAIVNEIAAAGDWAAREWLDILQTDEHLKLELRRVEMPHDLHDRLMAIPDQSMVIPPDRLWTTRLLRVSALAAAAVLLIAVTFFVTAYDSLDSRYDHLASLAMVNYAHEIDNRFHIDDPREMQIQLASTVPQIPVAVPERVPHLEVEARLSGGRMCHLGDHTVVCTEWIHDEQRYALYQFNQDDFDLPQQLAKRDIVIDRPDGIHGQVTIWAGPDGNAYALVRKDLASSHKTNRDSPPF